jgi:type IV pilus assembly protein PilB
MPDLIATPTPILAEDRMGAEPRDSRQASLGVRLIAAGLVTSAQVDEALAEQRQTGKRLGEILVAHDALFEDDLARTLAEMTGMPYWDLSLAPPDPSVLDYIPEAFCRRRGVLPVQLTNGVLTVAITDPRDIQTFDDLRTLVAVPFVVVVAAPDALRKAIESGYYSRLIHDDDLTEGAPEVTLTTDIPDADVSEEARIGRNQEPVIDFVNRLLTRAVGERASDIHIEPTDDGLRIRFRIDGMLRDVMSAPPSLRPGVISRVKIMTDMDIADHRRPQDGRMSMTIRGLAVDIRAATLPTIYGEAIVLRLLRRDQGLLDIDALGFLPRALERYQHSFRKAWGMILVTGPTGSGKSTTLYATISELNDPSRNTVTVEDPIEYRVAGIKQTQVNPRAGYTFASGLRAALRADPDIILIGEIRDLETARIATEAALTGHLVLSTLHANDAASSTTRLMDMGLGPYLVTSSLECVVAQRLVRRLCGRCKSTGPASSSELLELGAMGLIDPTTTATHLWRAHGCEQCGQSGYLGRLAVHEVLVMTDELRTLVLQRAPAEAVALAAVAGGMQTLQQDAFIKVQEGQTTFDELKRVLI